ncbi:MAG: DUF2188 domain-containing protein [Brevundimonas sp.]|nr:MAG: DUF2188 domain-containing protein [Brevundimonas sp.]
MSQITYRIVPHEDGWAYQASGTYSETFPSRDAALAAARRAAGEQHVAGETRGITWEDDNGEWHTELSDGHDRPDTVVEG